jgi:hypothetical protein
MRQAKHISEYAELKTPYINQVLRKAKQESPSGRKAQKSDFRLLFALL